MLVILAAKSSLLANVHGSIVFGANPVKHCAIPKRKIKKACDKLIMLIKARQRERREHLHVHQFFSRDLEYQLKVVKAIS